MSMDDTTAYACPLCLAAPGDYCRTDAQKVLLPNVHAERLQVEVRHLRTQRDELQRANNREVERRRKLKRAAEYVVANVEGHAGIVDHLKGAL